MSPTCSERREARRPGCGSEGPRIFLKQSCHSSHITCNNASAYPQFSPCCPCLAAASSGNLGGPCINPPIFIRRLHLALHIGAQSILQEIQSFADSFAICGLAMGFSTVPPTSARTLLDAIDGSHATTRLVVVVRFVCPALALAKRVQPVCKVTGDLGHPTDLRLQIRSFLFRPSGRGCGSVCWVTPARRSNDQRRMAPNLRKFLPAEKADFPGSRVENPDAFLREM